MSKTTKILVVGLGSIGRRHARLISERPEIELLMCDTLEQNRQECSHVLHRPASMNVAELDEALAAKPDLVIICTPNHLHVPIGLKALDAGADLLVEKPISNSYHDAEKLVHAARKLGRFLHVGYMLRHDPGLAKLRNLIDAGAIGMPVSGRAMIGTYNTLLCAKTLDRLSQPYNLVVDFTHELDFIRWFFGDVAQVFAFGATRGALPITASPNIVQMLLHMSNEMLMQVHMDYVQHPQQRIFEIHGDNGTLTYNMQTGEIHRFHFGREYCSETLCFGDVAHRVDTWMRNQLDDIIHRREVGEDALVPGEDGLAALAVAEAVIQSAQHGIVVDVEHGK